MALTYFRNLVLRVLFAYPDLLQKPLWGKDAAILRNQRKEISKKCTRHNIPALELDSLPDSSSSDSSFPEAGSIPDKSFPEAGSIPDKSCPEADSIPEKIGKMKLRIIVNHQFFKAMIKNSLSYLAHLF